MDDGQLRWRPANFYFAGSFVVTNFAAEIRTLICRGWKLAENRQPPCRWEFLKERDLRVYFLQRRVRLAERLCGRSKRHVAARDLAVRVVPPTRVPYGKTVHRTILSTFLRFRCQKCFVLCGGRQGLRPLTPRTFEKVRSKLFAEDYLANFRCRTAS